MIPGSKANASTAGTAPVAPRRGTQRPNLLHFPGLIAIGFYMILMAGIFVVNVVVHHAPMFYLIFAAMFITGALGLTMLLRWAWALTLAGVALLSASFLLTFSAEHSYPPLVQGLLNLVFFLYLVRTDLREKLR